MAKRKELIHAEKALIAAKGLLEERIRGKTNLQEASKISGKLWAQIIATALQRFGWTPKRFEAETGVSESAFRKWRDTDNEPEPEQAKILANFWEEKTREIALKLKRVKEPKH